MTGVLLILARNAWREQLRSRFFSVALVFGCVILYISTLLGMLAADQELRALLDFGLAFIELVTAAAAAFAAATGLVQEMQTKTIYLVLTRPVPKSAYLVGRALGLTGAAVCAVGLMAVMHLALLFAKGWAWEWSYLLALVGVTLKVAVMVSLAVLLTLVSTSVLSALVMTGIVWMLGHFVTEMRYLLLLKSSSAGAKIMGAFIFVVPNLQLFNLRDRLGTGVIEPLLAALLYAPLYASACLGGALALLRRREF